MRAKYIFLLILIISVSYGTFTHTAFGFAVKVNSVSSLKNDDFSKKDSKVENNKRIFCQNKYGDNAQPYFVYNVDKKTGDLSYKDSGCIKNTHVVNGKQCERGVKDIVLSGVAKCRACIQEFGNDIKELTKKSKNNTQKGIKCVIEKADLPNGDKINPTGDKTPPNNGGNEDNKQTNRQQTKPPAQQNNKPKPAGQSTQQNNKPKPVSKERAQKPVCSVFMALDTEITKGGSTKLQWAMNYASSAHISPKIGLIKSGSGEIKISPQRTTTYVLQMHNRYGLSKCTAVKVVVKDKEDVQIDIIDKPIKAPDIKCTPSSVRNGGLGLVLWRCPKESKYSTGSSTEYPKFNTEGKLEGSMAIRNIKKDSKFIVSCKDKDNKEISRNSCDISVRQETSNTSTQDSSGKATSYIKANKTSVSSGEEVTISWGGINTDNCVISGPNNFKEYGNRGSVTGRMLRTSIFKLSCIANKQHLKTKEIKITTL